MAARSLFEPDRSFVQAPPRQNVRQPAGLHLGGQPARVLGEEADGPHGLDLAGGGHQIPAQDLEEARLAGSVAAHQTDLVAGAYAEGGVLQSQAPADFDAQVGRHKHCSMIAARRTFHADFSLTRLQDVRLTPKLAAQ